MKVAGGVRYEISVDRNNADPSGGTGNRAQGAKQGPDGRLPRLAETALLGLNVRDGQTLRHPRSG